MQNRADPISLMKCSQYDIRSNFASTNSLEAFQLPIGGGSGGASLVRPNRLASNPSDGEKTHAARKSIPAVKAIIPEVVVL